MTTSPLTNKALAYQAISGFDADTCVDWAIEMVTLGYNHENILILAGLNKPTNHFETILYLEKALREIGLQAQTGRDAIISYCSYYISLLANGEHVKENLEMAHLLSQQLEVDSKIFDFSLLRWAWDDLDFDRNAFPSYWENASMENMEKLVIIAAKKWIETNVDTALKLHPQP